jgi:hypothetical protein
MKKILSLTFILIIFIAFTTTINARSSPRITIRSAEELAEMRIMAESSEIIEYLVRTGHYDNGLETRADVVAFLELLDSLPIPHEEGMRFTGLTYYLGSENQIFVISFMNETREIQSFRLYIGGDNGRSIIQESLNEEQLIEIYRSQDGKMIVYSPPKAWNSFPDERGLYFLPVEINGYFISAGYNPGNRNVSNVTPQSIYGNMTATTIRDLTWIDRNQPGDIFGEGRVTTENAIEILRFVAGLENDIRSQSVMAAADVNGDGKIDTADALEILKIVAGLL